MGIQLGQQGKLFPHPATGQSRARPACARRQLLEAAEIPQFPLTPAVTGLLSTGTIPLRLLGFVRAQENTRERPLSRGQPGHPGTGWHPRPERWVLSLGSAGVCQELPEHQFQPELPLVLGWQESGASLGFAAAPQPGLRPGIRTSKQNPWHSRGCSPEINGGSYLWRHVCNGPMNPWKCAAVVAGGAGCCCCC